MKASVHLHHFPKVFLALPPPPVSPPLPLPTPQPFRQHPASQRLAIQLQPVLRGQMLRRQRRTKALAYSPAVLLPHQLQDLSPELLRVGSIRLPPRAAMLQPRRTFLPVPPPQPLRLPVAQPHQPSRVDHPQLATLHPGQQPCPPPLPLAHLCSPQFGLLSEAPLGDTSIEEKRGHYHRGATLLISLQYLPSTRSISFRAFFSDYAL